MPQARREGGYGPQRVVGHMGAGEAAALRGGLRGHTPASERRTRVSYDGAPPLPPHIRRCSSASAAVSLLGAAEERGDGARGGARGVWPGSWRPAAQRHAQCDELPLHSLASASADCRRPAQRPVAGHGLRGTPPLLPRRCRARRHGPALHGARAWRPTAAPGRPAVTEVSGTVSPGYRRPAGCCTPRSQPATRTARPRALSLRAAGSRFGQPL